MGNLTSTFEQGVVFTPAAIGQQLERIFRDPHFIESDILKRFLSFIVEETITGRSNCLKEYTIAVKALEKPANFKPQENGIVRIHAGRLRRALSQYYSEKGINDPIVITIPKGKYVPLFTDRLNAMANVTVYHEVDSVLPTPHEEENMTLAVLPFVCLVNDGPIRSFADGLCLELSSTLMRMDHVSVIAHQVIKHLVQMNPDLRELSTSIGFNHIVTGGVQGIKDKLRINIQVIECNSYKQVWSETFERKLSKANIFEIQDEICQRIMHNIEGLGHRPYNSRMVPALSAVS